MKRSLLQLFLVLLVLGGSYIFVQKSPKNVARIIDSVENLTGQNIVNEWEEDSRILTDVAFKECTHFLGLFEKCSFNVKYAKQEAKVDALKEEVSRKLKEKMSSRKPSSKRDEGESSTDDIVDDSENVKLSESDVDDVDGSGNVKFYATVINKDLYLGKRWFSRVKLAKVVTEVHTVAKHGIKVVEDVATFNPYVNAQKAKQNTALEQHLAKNMIPYKVYKQVAGTSGDLTPVEVLNYGGWFNAGYGLWIKKGIKISSSSINDLNVLFGRQSVDPRNGWESLNFPLSVTDISSSMGKLETRAQMDIAATDYHQYDDEAYVFYKPRMTKKIKQNLPSVKTNGKFKILQLADLHFSTGYGKCADPWPVFPGKLEHCLADMITLDFVNEVLDLEDPDFVVLTGDQIFGEACPDSETALLKVVKPMVDRGIPYAAVFGNHDDEGGSLDRTELMNLLKDLPYSLSEPGPDDLSGVGNYVVDVPSSNSKSSPVVMYFLDSHAYPHGKVRGYDWIKEDQINAVRTYHDEVAHMKPIELVFFHIPLQEYRPPEGAQIIGSYKEGVMAGAINTGMYSTMRDLGIKFVSVGHDHCNDYCMKGESTEERDGVWMCYGGGAGEGGYGGYGGTSRRVRLFEVDTRSGSILTWQRLQPNPNETINEITLT